MNKTTSTILKGLVSVILLIILFSRINFGQFVTVVKNTNIPLLIIAGLLFYSGTYFSILRWNHFLKFYKIIESKSSLFGLYLEGAFLNNFLPSSIGGDGFKLFSLSKKYPDRKKEVLSSIVYERGSGFLLLLMINFCLFVVFIKQIAQTSLGAFIVEIVFLLSLALFIVLRKYLLGFLERLNIQNKIIVKLISFTKVLFSFNDRTIFFKGLFYSLLFSFNAAVGSWLLFLSLGLNVNLVYILFVTSFSQIVSILPISINAIGILEGTSVYLYSIAGIPAEISLAVALIARISMMITSSTGGILLLKGKQSDLSIISGEAT